MEEENQTQNQDLKKLDVISYAIEKIKRIGKNYFKELSIEQWQKAQKNETYILEDDLWESIKKNNDLEEIELNVSLTNLKENLFQKFKYNDFSDLANIQSDNKNLCLLNIIQKHDKHIYDSDSNQYLNLINYRDNRINENIWRYAKNLKITNFDTKENFVADIVIFLNGIPIILFNSYKSEENEEDISKLIKKTEYAQDDLDKNLLTSFQEVQKKYQKCKSFFDYLCFGVVFSKYKIKYGSFQNLNSSGNNINYFSEWNFTKGMKENNYSYIPYIKNTQPWFKVDRFFSSFFTIKTLHEFIRYFIFYKENNKIIAKYYQYFAVKHFERNVKKIKQKKAQNDLEWLKENKNKGGYAYHTPGSGKSFEMVFLVKKLQAKDTNHADFNQKFLIVTDRIALDWQIFRTFKASFQSQKNNITRIDSRDELRTKIREKIGGIFFTTIHKFLDAKSKKNDESIDLKQSRKLKTIIDEEIIVIIDEAHRTQTIKNNEKNKNFQLNLNKDDENDNWTLANQMRHDLPNGIFIGFTGTPVITEPERNKQLSLLEKDIVTLTEDLFGKKHVTYNLIQALNDRSIVKIHMKYRNFKEKTNLIEKKITTRSLGEKNFIKASALEIFKLWKNAYCENREKNKENPKNNISAMMIVKNRNIAFMYYQQFNELIKKQNWSEQEQKNNGWNFKVVISTSEFSKNFLKSKTEAEKKEIKTFLSQIEKREFDTDESQESFNESSDETNYYDFVIVADKWQTGVDFPRMSYMFLLKEFNKDLQLIQTISRVVRKFKNIKQFSIIHDFLNQKKSFNEALRKYCNEDEKNNFFIDDEEIQKLFVAKIKAATKKFPEIMKIVDKYQKNENYKETIFDLENKNLKNEKEKEILESYNAEKNNYNKSNNEYDKFINEINEYREQCLSGDDKEEFSKNNEELKKIETINKLDQKLQFEISEEKIREIDKKNNLELSKQSGYSNKNSNKDLIEESEKNYYEDSIISEKLFDPLKLLKIKFIEKKNFYNKKILEFNQKFKNLFNNFEQKIDQDKLAKYLKKQNVSIEKNLFEINEKIKETLGLIKTSKLKTYKKIKEIKSNLKKIVFKKITNNINWNKTFKIYKNNFELIEKYISNIIVSLDTIDQDNQNFKSFIVNEIKEVITQFKNENNTILINNFDAIGNEIWNWTNKQLKGNQESLFEKLCANYYASISIRNQLKNKLKKIIKNVLKKHFDNFDIKTQETFLKQITNRVFYKMNEEIDKLKNQEN